MNEVDVILKTQTKGKIGIRFFKKPFRDKPTTWKAANDFLACQSAGKRRRVH